MPVKQKQRCKKLWLVMLQKVREVGDAHSRHRNNDGATARMTPDATAMSAWVLPSHAAEGRRGPNDRPGRNPKPGRNREGNQNRENREQGAASPTRCEGHRHGCIIQ